MAFSKLAFIQSVEASPEPTLSYGMTGTEDACQSGGVMNLGQSLCNADVSLTDLIKRWSVALTKQLNA
jgi:hypothetical protein